MAYQWGPCAPAVPIVADHRDSSLHQQRSYLLSALATEESRAEHMTRALETTRAKLRIAEIREESKEAVGNLRKAAAATSRKLKKCQKNQRAMTNNLAAVTACMQMLEQHQWRKAQFEYSQRMQQTPMYGLSLGLQEMTIDSPMSTAYGHPCTPYAQTSYAMSPLSVHLAPMPQTPLLQPQSMIGMDIGWNTPLPTPYHQQFQTPLGGSTPFNTPQPGILADWQNMGMQHTQYAVFNEPIKRDRRMSLPNPPRRSGWDTTGIRRGIGQVSSATEKMEVGRKLSVADGTMISLRM